MNRTTPVLIIEDETGQLTRHYEDCPICQGAFSVKVHTASFATWCMEERTCESCSYFDKKIYGDKKGGIPKDNPP